MLAIILSDNSWFRNRWVRILLLGSVAGLIGLTVALGEVTRAYGLGILLILSFGTCLVYLVRTGRRDLAAGLLLAFSLRFVVALLIAQGGIIPEQYLTDHQTYHELGTSLSTAWASNIDTEPIVRNLGNYKAYVYVAATIYYLAGPSIFLMQVLNIVLMCFALLLIWLIVRRGFNDRRVATVTIMAMAVWPGGVIQDAMNNREAFAVLSLSASLWFFIEFSRTGKYRLLLLCGSALVVTGLFRDYLIVIFMGSVVAWLMLKRPSLKRVVLLASAVALTYLAVGFIARISPHIPDITEIFSPAGLQQYTASRVLKVGATTALFPDRVYRTWLDVFVALPKGFLAVLFLPLPGIYSTSNLAQMVAAAENIVLLLAVGLGLSRIRRHWSNLTLRFLLLATAVALTVHGLVDSDLGTATRHKRVFVPYILCFAAERLLRRDERGEESVQP